MSATAVVHVPNTAPVRRSLSLRVQGRADFRLRDSVLECWAAAQLWSPSEAQVSLFLLGPTLWKRAVLLWGIPQSGAAARALQDAIAKSVAPDVRKTVLWEGGDSIGTPASIPHGFQPLEAKLDTQRFPGPFQLPHYFPRYSGFGRMGSAPTSWRQVRSSLRRRLACAGSCSARSFVSLRSLFRL